MKYAYMSGNTGKYSISAQCEVFGVSRSGYYAWRHRQANPCKRQLFREKLDRRVFDAFHARKGRSGAFELSLDLAEGGHPYDRKTVAASLKRQGLVAKAAKKFKATTDSDHDLPVAPNLLDQGFSADAPNQKWVCDITYCAPGSRRWHGDARRDTSMFGIHMDRARKRYGPSGRSLLRKSVSPSGGDPLYTGGVTQPVGKGA